MKEYLTTAEFVSPFGFKPKSAIHSLHKRGHFLGCKPIKLDNRRLMWKVEDQQRALARGAK